MAENQYIKMGAYHTVDLEPNRKFTLYKEEWDSVSKERVESACDPTKVSELVNGQLSPVNLISHYPI